MAGRRPSPLHTVLLVCEGKTEKAFLTHLKSLYITRGCGATARIINARGKGPEYILDYAIRRSHRFAFDRILILMDNDVPIKDGVRKKANHHNFQLAESSPCLEGLLLSILDSPVPETSSKCKTACKKHFGGALTEKASYKNLTVDLLDQRRNHLPTLARLLDSFIFDD